MATGGKKSTQKKIGEVRAPRVQISYDVELGDAVTQKTLPFVVGVVADLNPGADKTESRFRDRSFVDIDVDNFDKVMAATKPTISIRVPNKLGGEENLRTELTFSQLEDFSPAAVAKKVPQLAQLMAVRGRLNDLLAKLEGNDRLNDLLAEVVLNTEVQARAQLEMQKRDADQNPETENTDEKKS